MLTLFELLDRHSARVSKTAADINNNNVRNTPSVATNKGLNKRG